MCLRERMAWWEVLDRRLLAEQVGGWAGGGLTRRTGGRADGLKHEGNTETSAGSRLAIRVHARVPGPPPGWKAAVRWFFRAAPVPRAPASWPAFRRDVRVRGLILSSIPRLLKLSLEGAVSSGGGNTDHPAQGAQSLPCIVYSGLWEKKKKSHHPCRRYSTSVTRVWLKKCSLGRLGGSVGWASGFGAGCDLAIREFEPRVGLCADSSEPGACFGFCVSLSLPLPCSLSLSISK